MDLLGESLSLNNTLSELVDNLIGQCLHLLNIIRVLKLTIFQQNEIIDNYEMSLLQLSNQYQDLLSKYTELKQILDNF